MRHSLDCFGVFLYFQCLVVSFLQGWQKLYTSFLFSNSQSTSL